MNNAIVIDIETLDTVPSAVILSIGAFAFNVNQLEEVRLSIIDQIVGGTECAFFSCVDTFGQLMQGRTVSAETQRWWREQGEDAHEQLIGVTDAIGGILSNLAQWIKRHPEARIYFRGPDFDGAILEHAYKANGIKCPWKYSHKRDVRTYIDALTGGTSGYLSNHTPCFTVIKHHALHDAMNDAEQMAIAFSLRNEVAKNG